MSKTPKTTEPKYYVVGRLGEYEGSRYKAREPREAVRMWCERQGYKFWQEYITPITVWTDDYNEPWSKFQIWTVDASQPPAWIIKPYRDDK